MPLPDLSSYSSLAAPPSLTPSNAGSRKTFLRRTSRSRRNTWTRRGRSRWCTTARERRRFKTAMFWRNSASQRLKRRSCFAKRRFRRRRSECPKIRCQRHPGTFSRGLPGPSIWYFLLQKSCFRWQIPKGGQPINLFLLTSSYLVRTGFELMTYPT